MTRNRIIAAILLVLIGALTFSPTFVPVNAVGVAMTSFTPATRTGTVGANLTIGGTINTTNGRYLVFFSNQVVVNRTASGNAVNATFEIPEKPSGNYTLTLQDVSKNTNATSSFVIITSYSVKVDKSMLTSYKQFQEGSLVSIWANVTGGSTNKLYSANITVTDPVSNESWAILKISTSSNGYGANHLVYPNASIFSRTPNTNYTGTYSVAFNATLAANLATDSFTIGLTNATQYHRFQPIDIKAMGYMSNESLNMKISTGSVKTYSANYTADLGGIFHTTWSVPFNATIGTYVLNITSIALNPTKKPKADVQTFSIPGFGVNVTTRNLAGDIVPYVTISVSEGKKTVDTATGDKNGIVPLTLETGNYNSTATFHSHPVGILPISVETSTLALELTCNLTNLRISTVTFVDGKKIAVPNVMIIGPDLSTNYSDINGITVIHSLWPGYNSYNITASRYNVQYNLTDLPSLRVNGTLVAWFNITIVCPNLKLVVNVTDAESRPINGATVVAQEAMGGLSYQNATSVNGLTSFECAFGNYLLTAYDENGIQLNQTNIQLLNLTRTVTNEKLNCPLYGLNITIKVVDYFGQPISNINVTLSRVGLKLLSILTQPNGTATFKGITGGNMEAEVYMSDKAVPYETINFVASEPKVTEEVRLNQFVLVAGAFVDVAALSIAIIIVVILLVILTAEIYRIRRARLKPES